MKKINIGQRILYTLMLPVIAYVFFLLLSLITGKGLFLLGVSTIYNSVYVGLIALAMSMNLTSGRFDFATGATLVLAAIVGGNISLQIGAGPLGFLIITIVCGAVIGLVSGLVYILLGLPPMVVSLGLAMLYEAVGGLVFGGIGITLSGKSMLVYAKSPWNIILIVVVLAILILLWDFSKFGYDRSSLASGQKISTDVGVNEKKNAVICYILAGALLGCAACVFLSKWGTLDPETKLASSSYFMNAFLPMFIGGAIGKYSSHPFGVFIGAVTQSIITAGLVALGVSNSIITVINGVIVMLFLIYTSNSYKLVESRMFKEKLEKAKAAKAAKAE